MLRVSTVRKHKEWIKTRMARNHADSISSRFIFNTNSETLETVMLRGSSKDMHLNANESYSGVAETAYTKVSPGTYE